jgi:hypothetical protein
VSGRAHLGGVFASINMASQRQVEKHNNTSVASSSLHTMALYL